LARKADKLRERSVLAGWLFVTTRYAAAKLIRGERRRQRREQEVFTMANPFENSEAAPDWARVGPVLDDALGQLAVTDREAILLRFFEGRPFAEVGAHLRLTENTARMRVERALDKLRRRLMRSGVTSTTSALAVALASQGVVAAPAGLGALVSGTALAGAAGAASATGAVMTFMSMSKLQLGILGAVAAGGTTVFLIQAQTNAALAQEIAALHHENRAATAVITPSSSARVTSHHEDRARDYDAALAQLATEAAALRQQNAAMSRAASAPAIRSAAGSDATKLDRFPQATSRVRPEYPKELREAGVTGEVLVEFVVDKTGTVQDAFPVSSTDQGFEAAAVAAVSQWKFGAGLKGGRPVNTRLQQRITFSMAPTNPTNAEKTTLSSEAPLQQKQPASTWF
jgi:RNA polymerase sigma factor (sigma-70 family)